MNYRESIPESMNLFDIDYLIEAGLINFDRKDNTIGITFKGVVLVENSQVNMFGRIDLANILGYVEAPDGGYTISNTDKKYH